MKEMRKKTVTILIAAMLVCLIGGCGQKQVSKAEPAVSDATKDVVEAGIDEALDQTEDVVEDGAEVEEEDTNVEAENEEVTEEESIDEPVQFLTVDDVVASQDKSADYGVNSTSCYDLDQFLDDTGSTPTDWFGDDKIMYEYSGRWAYPKINPCDVIESLVLNGRSDFSEEYSLLDGTENYCSLSVYSGLDNYISTESMVGADYGDIGLSAPVLMFTASTEYGDTNVYNSHMEDTMTTYDYEVTVDEEGNTINAETGEPAVGEDVAVNSDTYTFHIGNFTVQVSTNDINGFSQEDLEKIIDSFELVGEKAVAE